MQHRRTLADHFRDRCAGCTEVSDITARAEGPSGARQDHAPHAVVIVAAERLAQQSFHHLLVERVAAFGAVEGQRDH